MDAQIEKVIGDVAEMTRCDKQALRELCKHCHKYIVKCRCGPHCPVWLHVESKEAYCSLDRAEPIAEPDEVTR